MFSLNFWFQNVKQSSASQTAVKESQSQEDGKQRQDDGSKGSQTTCTSLSPPKKKRILEGPFTKL